MEIEEHHQWWVASLTSAISVVEAGAPPEDAGEIYAANMKAFDSTESITVQVSSGDPVEADLVGEIAEKVQSVWGDEEAKRIAALTRIDFWFIDQICRLSGSSRTEVVQKMAVELAELDSRDPDS